MKNNINCIGRRFRSCMQGSVSVAGAGAMFLMLLIVAIAIDSSRLVQSSTKLKSLNDNAAIAAAQEPNLTIEARKAIFDKVMTMGVAQSPEVIDFVSDFHVEETDFLTVLSATTKSKADLFFHLTTGDGKYVSAHSEVVVGKEHIEVALVLDISSSMKGQRISELRAAAKNFIEILMENDEIRDRVSISIVPYGGTVRLPSDLEDMLIPPATTDHWVGGTWNGCISIYPDDYSTGITPNDRNTFLPHFYVWTKSNPWCPNAGNEMTGLSSDADALYEKIDGYTLSDGTGTDIGTAWGLATLDPQWRGELSGVEPEYPRDFGRGTKKIMIVMTDGGITPQYIPLSSQLTGDLPYKTNNKGNRSSDSKRGFKDICDLAKSQDIEIYTVGFLMRRQHQIDTLQECASEESNHFEANLGELIAVFEGLANSITALRLSR